MAREDEHLLRAQRNEEFAASLDLNDPIRENWAVVACFYSALHYVQAYFVKYKIECHKHEQREVEIKRDARLRPAFVSYKWLYTVSRTARYHCSALPANHDVRSHLQVVKKQIERARQL
jgi:hypothetical protein